MIPTLLALMLMLPTTLYRGDTQVTPTCVELQQQVRFLAAIMVAAKEEGHDLGCSDQRDQACYAHSYVYMKAEGLGLHMARMYNEQCADA